MIVVAKIVPCGAIDGPSKEIGAGGALCIGRGLPGDVLFVKGIVLHNGEDGDEGAYGHDHEDCLHCVEVETYACTKLIQLRCRSKEMVPLRFDGVIIVLRLSSKSCSILVRILLILNPLRHKLFKVVLCRIHGRLLAPVGFHFRHRTICRGRVLNEEMLIRRKRWHNEGMKGAVEGFQVFERIRTLEQTEFF